MSKEGPSEDANLSLFDSSSAISLTPAEAVRQLTQGQCITESVCLSASFWHLQMMLLLDLKTCPRFLRSSAPA